MGQNKTMLTIREFYTKAYLIAEGRFGDLADYMETGNPKYETESGLQIKTPAAPDNPEQNIPAGITIELYTPITTNPRIKEGVKTALEAIWPKQPPTAR